MGKFYWGILLLVGWAMTASLAAAPNSVQITVSKKSDKLDKGQVGEEGTAAREGSKISYEIRLANTTFSDLADLTVEYIIFVERQKLGKKKDDDVVVRVAGSIPVAALTKKDPQTVKSKDVELLKTNLVGNFHYPNGGRIKVEDSIKGVWIRVSQAGQIIGEYTNPSTTASRGWEKS